MKYFNPKAFRVESIEPDLIESMIVENHYLHSLTIGTARHCFAIVNVKQARIVGALVFGEIGRPDFAKSISPLVTDNEITELKRVWIEDGTGTNTESWAIAQAFRMLPLDKKVVVSYADPAQGHTGKIYQALNGVYQELPEKQYFQISFDQKKWIHYRSLHRWYGNYSVKTLKEKLHKTFYVKPDVTKYRYLWFRCSRLERQRIVDTLRHPIKPYPKETVTPPEIQAIVC